MFTVALFTTVKTGKKLRSPSMDEENVVNLHNNHKQKNLPFATTCK